MPDSLFSDGWLRTGDLGRFDEGGYLAVTGRIKDVIIRGGENISPQLIESVLMSHAGVASMLRRRWLRMPNSAKIPVAFVVVREGVSPSAAQLRDHTGGQTIADLYAGRSFASCLRFPRTASGRLTANGFEVLSRKC